MWNTSLLKGQGNGAPLFLAWCLGTFATLLFCYLSIYFTLGSWDTLLRGMLILFIWEGFLLHSAQWRRVVWCVIAIGLVYAVDLGAPIAYSYFSIAQLLQAVLLFKQRERVWIWAALALLGNLDFPFVSIIARAAYGVFTKSLENLFWQISVLPFFILYHCGLQIAFGVIAAFLMPPIKKASQAQRTA